LKRRWEEQRKWVIGGKGKEKWGIFSLKACEGLLGREGGGRGWRKKKNRHLGARGVGSLFGKEKNDSFHPKGGYLSRGEALKFISIF